jgi:hypothetical protein
MTTKQLEHIAYKHLVKMGTYLCFEVMMPNGCGLGYGNNERVDLLSYETGGIWRFYELKISKSDFHSKAKKTFLGNFNYFIMPNELYEEVKDEIPKEIGVYTAYIGTGGMFWMTCVKKPIRQDLKIDRDKLMFSLMQSLSRENQKYRALISKEFQLPENELINSLEDLLI